LNELERSEGTELPRDRGYLATVGWRKENGKKKIRCSPAGKMDLAFPRSVGKREEKKKLRLGKY